MGSFALLLTPLLAQASTFSFLASLFGYTAEASGNAPDLNSQTMPLLAAAINPDPTATTTPDTIVDDGALVPEQGPQGTAADVNFWPASSQISVYTVHAGDTLSGIAALYNVSVNTILWANDIPNGIIQPGQTLVILPVTGIEHTVAAGETLASLAQKYKSDPTDIAQYNGLALNASLTVGSTIIIPDGELSATESGPVSTHSYSSSPRTSRGSIYEPYLGGSGPAIANYYDWPLEGGVVTQGLHGWNAVDIGAPKGTPIYAAAAGTVIVANDDGAWNGGYGNYVVIQHSNGTETLYAHASAVVVSAGEQVVQGQTIARVGRTGLATGDHLHFEVRGAQNPFAYLPLGSGDPQ